MCLLSIYMSVCVYCMLIFLFHGYIFFSLYLYALSQDMGVSRFIRWKPNKENTFIPEKSEKYTAAYDYFNYLNSKGANIRHKLNSGKIYELSLMFDTNLMRIFLWTSYMLSNHVWYCRFRIQNCLLRIWRVWADCQRNKGLRISR